MTDASRRDTIVGTGSVIAARKPFKVYAWVDRGHYQTGDAIEADFSAQTVDRKPVQGSGALKLLQVSYDKDGLPSEKVVQELALNTGEDGRSQQKLKADAPGQYRLSYVVTDAKKHAIEGGYVFVVTGPGFNGTAFRFNDLELVPEKREYAPGEKVRLMVNTNLANTTVLLFPRASNGICLKPELLHLNGKSTVYELNVTQRDMPNFFIEAATIGNGKVFSEAKEIVVPPESRVTNVEVLPSATEFKPGQKAHVKLKLTDQSGEPITGTTTITVYDKSVEYISGGSNIPEIRSFVLLEVAAQLCRAARRSRARRKQFDQERRDWDELPRRIRRHERAGRRQQGRRYSACTAKPATSAAGALGRQRRWCRTRAGC